MENLPRLATSRGAARPDEARRRSRAGRSVEARIFMRLRCVGGWQILSGEDGGETGWNAGRGSWAWESMTSYRRQD